MCLCICGPRIFGITLPDAAHLFNIFDGLSLPVIMSNLNKFRSFTLGGGGGGDLPHFVTLNTSIFIFISFIVNHHESHLDAVCFELTKKGELTVSMHPHLTRRNVTVHQCNENMPLPITMLHI